MRKDLNRRLIDVAYDIIAEERLPRPKDIRLRNSLHGTTSRRGTCIKAKYADNYRIIVHTSKAKFVECAKGNLVDKETGKRYRRALGEPLPFKRLVEVMGHEIAHLKFWKHDSQHKSYTKYIVDKLKLRLGVDMNNH